MKTVWYNLLAHPETLNRLRGELLEADRSHPMTKPFPSWKDVCDLQYLDACILEGVRLHPPFCLPLERVVPKGGMTIGQTFFPEGTVVGMSAYVVNRHKPTFGEDADTWNPDRWMVPKEQKQRREAAIMTVRHPLSKRCLDSISGFLTVRQFGAGRRVCLGRHIAMLELKKIVPVLLLRYEVRIVQRFGPVGV